jgi:hypothetical protein
MSASSEAKGSLRESGDLVVEVRIPLARPMDSRLLAALLVEMANLMDERFSEVVEGDHVTLADTMGFGGSTLLLSARGQAEEVCL